MASDSNRFDFLVIGGGFAGLTAALRATELGLHVALLEKGEGTRYPCNSRMSGGIIHVCFRDIRRKPEELYDAIMAATLGEVSIAQAQTLAQNAARFVDWLTEHGARFMRFNMQEAYRWCLAPPRSLTPGPDWVDRGPDRILNELMKQFIAGGGRALFKTKALRLTMAGRVCSGVVAERDGVESSYAAAAVLVADGGFQADRNAFHEHIGPNFDAVFQRGAASGLGDGIRMAAAAGARLTDRRPFYGHLLAREARDNEKLWPYPELDAFATAGIIVGRDGRRLVDESAGGIAVANALAHLSDPGCATAVFDADIWEGPGRAHRIPANPLLEAAGATIYRADSIEDLARLIEVPAEILSATIIEHNAAVAHSDFAHLTPPRNGPLKAFAIQRVPYMAIRIVPGITYTMGGIEIDGSARVLASDGAPIEGLFAAGATTGGLEGGGRSAYVGGIVKAGVFGLIAAEAVSRTTGKQMREVASARKTVRYPVLELIVRYGSAGALALSALAGAFMWWLAWGVVGWPAIPIAAITATIAYFIIRSYVEIVTLITEMLIPK